MHGVVPYDLIQDQGHESSKVQSSYIFTVCVLRYLKSELASDC